jgi:Tfp pilus assembly protein PilV
MREKEQGYSLVEALISLFIMSFGLLAVAQMMLVALGGPTLARSKSSATAAAEDRLEFLAEAYRQNPDGADLTLGAHGPDIVEIRNPNNQSLLNRFRINWSVSQVPDPRAGKVLHAKIVTVIVTPVRADGGRNDRMQLNKVVNMSTTFSARPE